MAALYRPELELYFWNGLRGPDADALLTGRPLGTYLVRPSSIQGHYAISFVMGSPTGPVVSNSLVQRTADGYQLSQPGAAIYPTLAKLIEAQSILQLPYLNPAQQPRTSIPISASPPAIQPVYSPPNNPTPIQPIQITPTPSPVIQGGSPSPLILPRKLSPKQPGKQPVAQGSFYNPSALQSVPSAPSPTPEPGEPSLRHKICKEMLETELSYVDGLRIALDVYQRPLSESGNILSNPEINKLFLNISTLQKLNTDLILLPLQRRLAAYKDDTTLITDLFLEWSKPREGLSGKGNVTSLIQEYKKYVTGHDSALEMLTEKLESNSLFADFHRVTMFSAEAKGQSLQSYLITPVQRVPRYILYLEDLKKRTPPGHPDMERVDEALEATRKCAASINLAQTKIQSMTRLKQLRTQIEGMDEGVQELNGFIKEGDCVYFTKGKGTDAYFLLFTTVLLVVEKTKKGKMNFKLRFPLSELMILAKEAEEQKFALMLSLKTGGRTEPVEFSVTNRYTKKAWIEALMAATQAHRADLEQRETMLVVAPTVNEADYGGEPDSTAEPVYTAGQAGGLFASGARPSSPAPSLRASTPDTGLGYQQGQAGGLFPPRTGTPDMGAKKVSPVAVNNPNMTPGSPTNPNLARVAAVPVKGPGSPPLRSSSGGIPVGPGPGPGPAKTAGFQPVRTSSPAPVGPVTLTGQRISTPPPVGPVPPGALRVPVQYGSTVNYIIFSANDDPETVAAQFCSRNGLGEDLVRGLAQRLSNRITLGLSEEIAIRL